MRMFRVSRLLVFLLWAFGGLLPAQGLLPEVHEQKLRNGVRVLLVERPGTGAVHARLFLQGGMADAVPLPAVAADLLARCVFGPPVEGETKNGKDLEALLKWEEGAFESLRLERLRLARHSSGEGSQELQDLVALHKQAYDRIQELVNRAQTHDPLADLGATQRETQAEADLIAFGSDLPKEGLDAYLRYLAERLKKPLLARFPVERTHLLDDSNTKTGRDRKALDALFGTALSGQTYAQVFNLQRADLEALTWSDMRTYARAATDPGHIVLVLVGDVRMLEVFPSIERTFGGLEAGPKESSRKVETQTTLPDALGARRLQASIPGEMRLFMGWRVPPLTHPDHPALQVLVQMLGGGITSRLPLQVEGDRHLAHDLSVRLNVPGGSAVNLLLIEAYPAERHALAEVEQAIRGELIHLQRGAFQDGEIRRAQRQVEVAQLMVQEDAAQLAKTLGTAVCQGGDWRLAFRAFQIKQDFTQQEIQGIAQKYLSTDQSTIAMLEPDPTFLPQDHLESQTAVVLTKILEAKLDNPGQVEAVVREALRQLRMLPIREREQTLKLLESQVKP